ncbi:unnamed protein product [Rotaria socialis]|uniref:Uncharacterized protein n=1 Tax=Rotaria socialis TaxID=392032 RepID=A0A821T8V1_9BILA|nr:unnamed protein product [Rotaria socialis]CAF4543416.1 unnamed protein product [Rotaria socialis]CAF4864593.1 unnamed protein product [Rotaria socialis]CAF4872042.1 unnamed protein product [Rotaria socialis]
MLENEKKFKREIVLVYKQLHSLCLELIYIHTHTYSSNMSTPSSISDTVDSEDSSLKTQQLEISFATSNEDKRLLIHKNYLFSEGSDDQQSGIIGSRGLISRFENNSTPKLNRSQSQEP